MYGERRIRSDTWIIPYWNDPSSEYRFAPGAIENTLRDGVTGGARQPATAPALPWGDARPATFPRTRQQKMPAGKTSRECRQQTPLVNAVRQTLPGKRHQVNDTG